MRSHHLTLETHAADFWLARGAIVLIAGLQLMFLNNNLPFGPRWLAPAFEIAMLAPLSIATSWTRQGYREASTDRHWREVARRRKIIRILSLVLTGAVMLINCAALVVVVRVLLHGAKVGQSLLIDAMNIWFTNVVIFALWFWNIDLGGAVMRGLDSQKTAPDFLFPQMLGTGDRDPGWTPGFIDYFYVSFTNATAFSPTDTMPLSARSKLLMTIEASISLLTVGLVAARAVNILS